ncbi:MAG: four helix bundle protein [Alphaproteobacteria bacterium]|nr:four helix bundle protein [Alphaproteobacteria bacterium]MBQ9090144.1 four helix bundle protein [Alphaproteobacteria bacterium]
MSRSDKLPIYIATYQLIRDIHQYSCKFSREHKYTLGNTLNETALELCALISQANHSEDKSIYIDTFMFQLEKTRVCLRLCADLNLISCRAQSYLAQTMEIITTQATAWSKAERRKKLSKISAGIKDNG